MIDLHTHSTASDGFLSPSELLHAAEKIGLEALALTDHDAVSGLDELHAAAAKNRKVEIVNGAELSVFYPGAEMEILALDIPEKSLPAFREYQQNELARRDQMAHRRIELLQNFGVDITYEEVALDKDGNPRTQIRRPHFTDVLLKKGYIQNTEEAYKVVFARGGIAFVENRPAPAAEIIDFIRSNGAAAVMAHPIHTKFKPDILYNVVRELQQAGLSGIEVFHASQPRANRQLYLDIIRDLGLITAGGSDFHGGTAHPENKLGTGRRHNLNMPYMVLEQLHAAANAPAANTAAPLSSASPVPPASYYAELEKYLCPAALRPIFPALLASVRTSPPFPFPRSKKNAAPLDFSPPAPYINRQDTSKGADMEIEYIYPDPKDDRDLDAQLKKMQKENTLGCLIMGLFLLGGLFIFLTLLPILLIILGYSIIVLAVYIAYKAWLEEPVLNLIQKLKSRRNG